MALLRGCISLQAGANRPVACVIPCVRFNRAVSPPVGLGFREHVWSRGVLRGSDGLANTTATLGSFYWLGFETSGLSPDKKRLTLLGAQRNSTGTDGARGSDDRKQDSQATRCSESKAAPSDALLRLVLRSYFLLASSSWKTSTGSCFKPLISVSFGHLAPEVRYARYLSKSDILFCWSIPFLSK